MSLDRMTALVTGESGSVREALERHLGALGAELSSAEPFPSRPVRYLFHVWEPQDGERLARPSPGWYEAAVVAPVRLASRVAAELEHLCLVRTEDSSVPSRVLEEALAFLARQRNLPFAVVRAASGAGRLPEVAAFVATAGIAGRILVGEKP
ncbi:MAG: hypothetical protein HY553_15720 [Elusimicrobia bacterium]|nr:hypothetical protein [Elusimicrobiota bacterium]